MSYLRRSVRNAMEPARTLVSYEHFCWLLDLGFTLKFELELLSPYRMFCVVRYKNDNPHDIYARQRDWCCVYYATQELPGMKVGFAVSSRMNMFQRVQALPLSSFEPQKLQEKS